MEEFVEYFYNIEIYNIIICIYISCLNTFANNKYIMHNNVYVKQST